MCQQFLNTVGETKKKAQNSVTKQITEEKQLIYYLKTAVVPTASIWWKFIFTIKGPTVRSSEIRHLPEERKIITIFHIIASAKDMSKNVLQLVNMLWYFSYNLIQVSEQIPFERAINFQWR